ncbi:hypothetical protein RFI_30302 [Reticulomyxa filosa]|uniref:Reverse transcriptase domain-containing protein n=1 Tax=Reticulomyxa filosa TaxID=46433 RepID=X6M0F1_RETFI|nr:hypothetical protein RFI_30302 [Reticulomyxa filosa]|eukprot:ETO07091.1 hypothetical protein RFI_30302 [Reticulomyxa filosa]
MDNNYNYCVKDTFDLVDKLKRLENKKYTMIGADIKNFFLIIKIQELENALSWHIDEIIKKQKHNKNIWQKRKEYMINYYKDEELRLFSCDNRIYRTDRGVGMGDYDAPIAAQLVRAYKEMIWLKKKNMTVKNELIKIFGYMDDILIIIDEEKYGIEKFIKEDLEEIYNPWELEMTAGSVQKYLDLTIETDNNEKYGNDREIQINNGKLVIKNYKRKYNKEISNLELEENKIENRIQEIKTTIQNKTGQLTWLTRSIRDGKQEIRLLKERIKKDRKETESESLLRPNFRLVNINDSTDEEKTMKNKENIKSIQENISEETKEIVKIKKEIRELADIKR